jgi:Zn-dependent metalloprotease
MNNQHLHSRRISVCPIIPPYILESIAQNGSPEQKEIAQRTLQQDHQIRMQRAAQLKPMTQKAKAAATLNKNRLMYNANNLTDLPGKLVRTEGQAATNDVDVDDAYAGFGATFDLFSDIYKRNSIDDKGMDMIATVHYDVRYNNAFWDGTQMVFGDGDGTIFKRFTISIDIMGHELTHGVTEHTAGLEYHDQPGALNESISDVFGSLVKQRSLGQTAKQADWLIGAGLLADGINGVALRSMKAPGTAYDDFLLGKDNQPDHMSKYVDTTQDNGGVHINSGIPNKAFYLAAISIGGNAWEVAGNIWYQTLLDSRLTPTAQFQDFANLTVENAGKLYDDAVKGAVAKAWKDVGINVRVSDAPLAKQISVAQNKDGRLEVFCIGLDDTIYHSSQLSPGGGDWAAWKPLEGKKTDGVKKPGKVPQGQKIAVSSSSKKRIPSQSTNGL